eukprot:12896392-Prorocentrum_lima.AAC.1
MSPIAWVEDIPCPFDVGARVYRLQVHSLAEEHTYPDIDVFLIQTEADMNPRYWLYGSDCYKVNPYRQAKTGQYD